MGQIHTHPLNMPKPTHEPWRALCFLISVRWRKPLPQTSQILGFSPVWIRLWTTSVWERLNALPQTLQGKRRSPVWIMRTLQNCLFSMNKTAYKWYLAGPELFRAVLAAFGYGQVTIPTVLAIMGHRIIFAIFVFFFSVPVGSSVSQHFVGTPKRSFTFMDKPPVLVESTPVLKLPVTFLAVVGLLEFVQNPMECKAFLSKERFVTLCALEQFTGTSVGLPCPLVIELPATDSANEAFRTFHSQESFLVCSMIIHVIGLLKMQTDLSLAMGNLKNFFLGQVSLVLTHVGTAHLNETTLLHAVQCVLTPISLTCSHKWSREEQSGIQRKCPCISTEEEFPASSQDPPTLHVWNMIVSPLRILFENRDISHRDLKALIDSLAIACKDSVETFVPPHKGVSKEVYLLWEDQYNSKAVESARQAFDSNSSIFLLSDSNSDSFING
uniref:(California timema) hypothetical protein n=1 Tax=Timema californicum TaxID=61474 RepID=A0A7R9P988_TIMCA|nr:unnamed protein product [Timema californicum]